MSVQERIASLIGLGRRRVPPHVFAVDAERLQYGRFAGETSRLELNEYRERPLPAGLWSDGPLGGPARDPQALAEAVEELVGSASARPDRASLVVPDLWLRLAFTELNELPVAGDKRDEVLRWKLKGLVPYRVEELRIEASELDLPATEGGRRIALGFGVESLLAQLEEVFSGAGIELGQLLSSGLALSSLTASLAATPGGDGTITALAYVRPAGYGLAFQRGGALLFHRAKQLGGNEAETAGQVRRDLMLTRSFLEESFPESTLGELLLLAPTTEHERWSSWLEEGFEHAARPLYAEDLPVARHAPVDDWLEVAPLLGAALGEY